MMKLRKPIIKKIKTITLINILFFQKPNLNTNSNHHYYLLLVLFDNVIYINLVFIVILHYRTTFKNQIIFHIQKQ